MLEETNILETPDDLRILFEAFGANDEEALAAAQERLEHTQDDSDNFE